MEQQKKDVKGKGGCLTLQGHNISSKRLRYYRYPYLLPMPRAFQAGGAYPSTTFISYWPLDILSFTSVPLDLKSDGEQQTHPSTKSNIRPRPPRLHSRVYRSPTSTSGQCSMALFAHFKWCDGRRVWLAALEKREKGVGLALGKL
ncbi:hypothetical protein AYX13_00190 [Cryptococcus neoformans]|nr:hypothetical protein AYX13_00190 [Cryptococcus neoformans var. grubii]